MQPHVPEMYKGSFWCEICGGYIQVHDTLFGYGDGKDVVRLNHTKQTYTLLFTLPPSPPLLFSVSDLHSHGEQSDAEAQDQPPALWHSHLSHC